MRAQLSVGHNPADLEPRLKGVFPQEDPGAVARMFIFSEDAEYWTRKILFATETPTYRLACWSDTDVDFQVIIEPKGDHKAACQIVWDGVRRALDGLKPSLKDLRIIDDVTSGEVTAAGTSFRSSLGRRENKILMIVGLANAAWVVVAALTFGKDARGAVIGAGVPGVISGLTALLWGTLDWIRRRLVWE
jgi:hypothetical protein